MLSCGLRELLIFFLYCVILPQRILLLLTSSHDRPELYRYDVERTTTGLTKVASTPSRCHNWSAWHPGAAVGGWHNTLHSVVCRGLRGGENVHTVEETNDAARDAAVMLSIGETVCEAEERQICQLRERLVTREALDDQDLAYLAALRSDPTNVPAIKAHASALLHASGLPHELLSLPSDARPRTPQHLSGEDVERENAAGVLSGVVVGAQQRVGGEERARLIRRASALDLYRYVLMLQPSDADSWVALANIHLAAAEHAEQGHGGLQAASTPCPPQVADLKKDTPQPHLPPLPPDRDTPLVPQPAASESISVARAMTDVALRLEPSHYAALLARGNMQREVDGVC